MPLERGKEPGFRLTKGWVVTVVGCGLAIYLAVQNQGRLSGLGIGPAKMDFGSLGAEDPGAKKLAEKIKQGERPPEVSAPAPAGDSEKHMIQELAAQQPASPGAAALPDVVGTWRDQTGAQVTITSLGNNALAYSETSNLYGMPVQTAMGQGTWNNGRFEFTFNTILGLPGVAVLQPNGKNNLVGQASTPATGGIIPLSLAR